MSNIVLKKAAKQSTWLKVALTGPSGSGKTYTALRIAHGLNAQHPEAPIVLIDTENGSANVYGEEPNPDGGAFDFYHIDLSILPGKYNPKNYLDALHAARNAGAKVVIIDSLSHAWFGEGGVLDIVDRAQHTTRNGRNDKFSAWRDATPIQNQLMETLLGFPGHLICTMRTKTEYEVVNGERRKVGLAPVQRDGVEYEFSVVIDMNEHHVGYVTKSRIAAIADRSFQRPGREIVEAITEWMQAPTVTLMFADRLERVGLRESDGFTEANVDRFLASQGKPGVSTQPADKQQQLATWLAGPKGRAAFAEWLQREADADFTPDDRGEDLDRDRANVNGADADEQPIAEG